MKRFHAGFVALACIVLCGACQQGAQSDESSAEEEEELSAVPVEIDSPVRGDIFATYSATAPIEAFAEADIISKVDGEIREIRVEEGDTVKKNQVLAILDGDRLRLELSESQARLQKLRRDFERNEELKAKGLISEGDFEKLRYDLEALQASYNLDSLELDYTQIRATIDGVVAERYVKLGNTVKIGDPIFHVTTLQPMVAYLHIPEREFRKVAADQAVQISIDAVPGEPLSAQVTRISPVVDPDTGTFKVTIEIRDAEQRVKPGMFGRMSIIYDQHENALQLPRNAVIERGGEQSIFVVEDGIAVRKLVETGFSHGGMLEITSGLDDSDKVITVGHIGLKDKSKVEVIDTEDGASD